MISASKKCGSWPFAGRAVLAAMHAWLPLKWVPNRRPHRKIFGFSIFRGSQLVNLIDMLLKNGTKIPHGFQIGPWVGIDLSHWLSPNLRWLQGPGGNCHARKVPGIRGQNHRSYMFLFNCWCEQTYIESTLHYREIKTQNPTESIPSNHLDMDNHGKTWKNAKQIQQNSTVP